MGSIPEMTAAERELALWLCQGQESGTIAEWLGCSIRTVQSQVAALYNKWPNLATLRKPSGTRHRTYAASQFGREGMNLDAA